MRDANAIVAMLAARDGAVCYLCGQGRIQDDPFEIEHIKPRAASGTDDLENLALAHRSCNRTKGIHAVTKESA